MPDKPKRILIVATFVVIAGFASLSLNLLAPRTRFSVAVVSVAILIMIWSSTIYRYVSQLAIPDDLEVSNILNGLCAGPVLAAKHTIIVCGVWFLLHCFQLIYDREMDVAIFAGLVPILIVLGVLLGSIIGVTCGVVLNLNEKNEKRGTRKED
jgi:hypothetical protein